MSYRIILRQVIDGKLFNTEPEPESSYPTLQAAVQAIYAMQEDDIAMEGMLGVMPIVETPIVVTEGPGDTKSSQANPLAHGVALQAALQNTAEAMNTTPQAIQDAAVAERLGVK